MTAIRFAPRALVALSVASVLLAAGCGSSDRVGASGQVTLNGQPLSNGSILFYAEGSTAPAGGATITAGKYEVAPNPGLPPGQYTVSITASAGGEGGAALALDPKAKTKTPGRPAAAPKELVPAKYNSKTELRAEVRASGPNTFDFDLK